MTNVGKGQARDLSVTIVGAESKDIIRPVLNLGDFWDVGTYESVGFTYQVVQVDVCSMLATNRRCA